MESGDGQAQKLASTTSNNSRDQNVDQPDQQLPVQYVLVRSDLKWTKGAMIAQACHASVASIAKTIDQPHTKKYLAHLKDMRKVVLKAESGEELTKIASQLEHAKVDHHLWIEQPENVASCLAVAPKPKHLIEAFFSHLRLLR